MSAMSQLEQSVSYNRSKMVEHLPDQSQLAAIAAYDGVTELLLAIVNELQELRRA